MKLLLHADVPRLGYYGDVVDVVDGYARNYLIPQGLATEPTEANIRNIAEERARRAKERELARGKLIKLAEQVNDMELVISAMANDMGHLFGSVGPDDVVKALVEKGFGVKDKYVVMPEHFRMLGDYEVKLYFAEDIEAKIKVRVVSPEQAQQQDSQENADGDSQKAEDNQSE